MIKDDVEGSAAELSELQLKCLEGFWNRKPIKCIAHDLGISEGWVNQNLASARSKLHASSSAEAAMLVFGGKRGSVKKYYSEKTTLSGGSHGADHAVAGATGPSFEPVASERALINRFGVGQTLGLILAVSVGLIAGLLLMLQAAIGLNAVWRALGY